MSNATATSPHTTEKTTLKLDELKATESKLLLGTYDRYPLLFERGEGMHLIDENGVRYLDLLSGIGVMPWATRILLLKRPSPSRATNSFTSRTCITTRARPLSRCA
jgi:hypothetical protein